MPRITEKEKIFLDASQFSARAVALDYFLDNGISNDEELEVFLKNGLDLVIPNRVNCGKPDHRSPFDFISSMYFGRVEDALVHANRSGGKSFDGGVLTFMNCLPPNTCSTRILGGSLDQSEKSYEAFSFCWGISQLSNRYLVSGVLRQRTDLQDGNRVEILTASQKAVRGPHQPKLILDEVEEMERPIYDASLSQPQSKGNAKASTLIMSTQHKADGIMAELLTEYEKRHYTLFRWCVFEVLSNCKDYSCSRCALASFCPGKQMKHANGYYLVSDFEKKLYQLDEESLETEWLCEKPSRKHLVYSKFDENKHVVDIEFNPGLPITLALDWGGVDPFVVLVWQKLPDLGDVIVDEVWRDNVDNQFVISVCKSTPWWKHAENCIAYCDPSRQDLIREWRNVGVNAMGIRSSLDDVSLVRTKLAPMRGPISLHISKNCKRTIWEFNHYPRSLTDGRPLDRHNHTMDALRYKIRGSMVSNSPGGQMKVSNVRGSIHRRMDSYPLFLGDK